ncbi:MULTISPECIES: ANTAR domain-containing protein [Streptomyces]|uniref:ANTAR domain-containing protein n=1 Tax=Streptomyces TaxID=1883 RepID=UPI0029313FA6|nr:ANTAR domain-containing protein [Streptomyces sp. NEAU-HV9]
MNEEADSRALPVAEPTDDLHDPQSLPRQSTDLRNRMLAHTAVSHAQGILKERYRLRSLHEGFELLRKTSQRHNIKLHTLADAVIRIPGPAHQASVWFPGRARTSPPPLTGLRSTNHNGRTHAQAAVLGSALDRVLDITQTTMGNLQLAENNLLRLARHTGLNRQFTDYFTFVDGVGTACAQAAKEQQQVTVHDVATAGVFDEESRRAILDAGSRACHSLPVMGERNILLGVISSHHPRPLKGLTRTQLDALQTTGVTLGRWLSWHRRTVVLDALEDLHTAGRQAT